MFSCKNASSIPFCPLDLQEYTRRLTNRFLLRTHDMPLLDTSQGRDLTGTLISDLVLQILSYVAQKEREFIRQRQAEGIAAAHEKGVVFGRPPKAIPAGYEDLVIRWKANDPSARQAAAILGVSHVTFLKWARDEKSKIKHTLFAVKSLKTSSICDTLEAAF